ncbi:hypothetical protein D9M68_618950 [compost metagenome]
MQRQDGIQEAESSHAGLQHPRAGRLEREDPLPGGFGHGRAQPPQFPQVLRAGLPFQGFVAQRETALGVELHDARASGEDGQQRSGAVAKNQQGLRRS